MVRFIETESRMVVGVELRGVIWSCCLMRTVSVL